MKGSRKQEAFEYEYKKVNTKNIVVDNRYQRVLNPARIKKIVAEYNPNLVNAVKVSYRDGKYYCFDGQHTMKAQIARNKGQDLYVDCKVFYGMTYDDESYLFAMQFGLNKAITTANEFRALYEGKDKDVISFKEAIEDCGIICDFHGGGANSQNRLICYSTVWNIYRNRGEIYLKNLLQLIKECWDGDPQSLTNGIICGIDLFIRTYDGEYEREKLVNSMKKTTPDMILRKAKEVLSGKKSKYGRVILYYYNYQRSSGKLPDKFQLG